MEVIGFDKKLTNKIKRLSMGSVKNIRNQTTE
jgi:hypothetical protein